MLVIAGLLISSRCEESGDSCSCLKGEKMTAATKKINHLCKFSHVTISSYLSVKIVLWKCAWAIADSLFGFNSFSRVGDYSQKRMDIYKGTIQRVKERQKPKSERNTSYSNK